MKNILIVGAGKGIGLKTAELLTPDHALFTISRNETVGLQQLNSKFYQLDITKDPIDQLNELPEAVHGLVYCPGSINLKPFNRLSTDDFMTDMQQNFFGAVKIIHKVLPNLKHADGASIVLFSSVDAKVGMPFHTSIAAGKGAIEGFAKSLAAEFAASKIRVNVVAPSLTDTSLASSLLNTPEKRESAAKRHPLQRIGNTDDIAKIVCFLLSEESTWITGQLFAVDGGMSSLKV